MYEKDLLRTILNQIAVDENLEFIHLINEKIHPKDEMYIKGKEDHYFKVGLSAISCIEKALIVSGVKRESINNILDFPCGYGRVMRFLRAYFPQATIAGSEIDENYLEFCQKEFACLPILSNTDFTRIKFNTKYNLIWCGSLFTHLSKDKFIKLLQVFTHILESDGLLVFTNHGRFSLTALKNRWYGIDKKKRRIVEFGYKFLNYGYTDYAFSKNYGLSLIKPSWIIKQLEKSTSLKIIMYLEKGWDNHQDVIVCKKESVMM
ncbi:class I SAM-dependent methyltransferase [Rhodocytophaga aerolata]|uniref:Class I SAM-dependent methyltransferase n=1 Tax=Rhodocytophaga aerolata TaxID=455078 RepID=A0ABT8R695_9BACT|nr:class I SAM-dependent methyltransferase [Rhodocytophaga aerolata]MDO1447621.1 class I SAM-dependent methyltransferase [Rhodocytophaga aerolata]